MLTIPKVCTSNLALTQLVRAGSVWIWSGQGSCQTLPQRHCLKYAQEELLTHLYSLKYPKTHNVKLKHTHIRNLCLSLQGICVCKVVTYLFLHYICIHCKHTLNERDSLQWSGVSKWHKRKGGNNDRDQGIDTTEGRRVGQTELIQQKSFRRACKTNNVMRKSFIPQSQS